MSKLRIEKLAAALGKDPLSLSSLELRKFCILIDWALTLETYQSGHSFTPRLLDTELDSITADSLISRLTKAIKDDGFAELDLAKPDCEQMDNMFQSFANMLGFNDDMIEDILQNTGFIFEYEDRLLKEGLIYTDFLKYKCTLSSDEANTLQHLEQKLLNANPWLPKQSLLSYDSSKSAIVVNELLFNTDSKKYFEQISFILNFALNLSIFNNKRYLKVDEHSLQKLYGHLALIIAESNIVSFDFVDFKKIETLLISIIKNTARTSPNNKILKELLSTFISQFPMLRGWKTLSEYTINEPIHRVILLGHDDIIDEEVTDSVNMMIKNHPHENIVITYCADDVVKASQRNRLFSNLFFTLQVIGHGTQVSDAQFTANLGSFRGSAQVTGKALAELVNQCSNIHHIRMSCCFSGQINHHLFKIEKLNEKQRPANSLSVSERRTLTLVNEGILSAENSPFAMNTAALSCWNALNLNGRHISMTSSPGLIEPDHQLGRMMWKPSCDDLAPGIKEICVTTSQGPKAKLLHALENFKQAGSYSIQSPSSEQQELNITSSALELLKL